MNSINTNTEIVNVWDLPVRLFHWTLVLGFSAAYLTAKFHIGFLHTLIGYFLIVLLLARVLWGFTGNQYARFSSFVYPPVETVTYLRSLLHGNPRHYLGHNPAGALMVFSLLSLLSLVFLSGLLTLSVIDFEGPLLSFTYGIDDGTSYAIRHLHGWLVNIALLLISLHVTGVVVGSFQHKENLVKAMITGIKRSASSSTTGH